MARAVRSVLAVVLGGASLTSLVLATQLLTSSPAGATNSYSGGSVPWSPGITCGAWSEVDGVVSYQSATVGGAGGGAGDLSGSGTVEPGGAGGGATTSSTATNIAGNNLYFDEGCAGVTAASTTTTTGGSGYGGAGGNGGRGNQGGRRERRRREWPLLWHDQAFGRSDVHRCR